VGFGGCNNAYCGPWLVTSCGLLLSRLEPEIGVSCSIIIIIIIIIIIAVVIEEEEEEEAYRMKFLPPLPPKVYEIP